MVARRPAGVRRRSRSSPFGFLAAAGAALFLILAAALLVAPACRRGALAVKLEQKQAADKPSADDIKEHAATGFPLEGRHAGLVCEACHGRTEPKPDCASCHASHHETKLKKSCTACHTPGRPFAEIKFAHPAKGLWAFHRDARCADCHVGLQFRSAGRNCTACHADFHNGAAGRDCSVCHREPAWTVASFNHAGAGFPLMGAHRALECGDCHRDLQSFRITPRPGSCAACHESAYRSSPFPHAAYGAGLNCQECHLQDSWSYAHSPFWFNIQTGSMAGLECASCHKNASQYREYTCHDCHAGHAGDHDGRCIDCHRGGPPLKRSDAAEGRRP